MQVADPKPSPPPHHLHGSVGYRWGVVTSRDAHGVAYIPTATWVRGTCNPDLSSHPCSIGKKGQSCIEVEAFQPGTAGRT